MSSAAHAAHAARVQYCIDWRGGGAAVAASSSTTATATADSEILHVHNKNTQYGLKIYANVGYAYAIARIVRRTTAYR